MFKNNLKLAWRNLLRDRQFSVLNLIGLSLGLACAFLIFLWVQDEMQVDTFNKNDSQLYQVMKTGKDADGTYPTNKSSPARLAEMMMKDMPDVEMATAVFENEGTGVLSVGERHFKATARFADTNYLKVFSYRLIQGNRNKILADKYGVLLSDRLAINLFHTTENLIGKTVTWDQGNELNGSYKITGVFETPPANATDQFDMIVSYSRYFDTYQERYGLNYWGSNSVVTYIMLKKGVNVKQFNHNIREYSRTKYKALHGTDGLEWEGRIFLQRYSERYLHNHFGDDGLQIGGRIEYVILFSIIAIFILLIACINFMNLSTAKASGRLKEVGIKKVVGAGRGNLIMQYMGESLMMAFLALLIAVAVVLLLLPVFKVIAGKEINLHLTGNIIISILSTTTITGLIAGSYPALYLSGFKPVAILKGKIKDSPGESWVRKGMVVFQFSISVILIIAVLVIYKQVNYIHSKNLGFNRDNIISFKNEGNIRNHLPAFLAEVKSRPGVINASSMSGDLVGNHGGGGGISWPGKPAGRGIEFSGIDADYDLMETLGLKMAEGRMFSRQSGNDSAKVIFNQAAIAAMQLKNPVGQMVDMWGIKFQIIGVVKDFHYESLYNKVGPFFIRFSQNDNDNVMVKIKHGKEKETLSSLEKFYKEYNLGLPFEYKFLDEDFQHLYAAEERVATLSKYFAGIAILISCLGLFGLAAFTAQKRQKEIGIRKVIGATIGNIAMMLSMDFLKLVVIAVLFAFPLAWWAMDHWLQAFAYRVVIGINVFIIAGVSVIFICLLTISFQALKAAGANPIKSLRTE